MDAVFLIARILFAFIFLLSAWGHISKASTMAQYAQYKGAPGGKVGVILSGITMGLGALMVLLGIYGDLGALLVFVTLIPVTLFMHAYWKESDAQAKGADRTSFNKNVGLLGGALAFFLLFAAEGADLGLTIVGPLFHLS